MFEKQLTLHMSESLALETLKKQGYTLIDYATSHRFGYGDTVTVLVSTFEQEFNVLRQYAKNCSYDQTESAFYGGHISPAVYESYCYLWRTMSYRYSNLCAGYASLELLSEDTQALVKAYKELQS